MKTETKSSASTHKTHSTDCLPCDIQPFCRNNYFTGKLLTERDFTTEQTYMMDKLRLHHLALHGWGVICGLKVIPHPHCPELRIGIEPGLAIDSCGREIVVSQAAWHELPKAEAPPAQALDYCPPEPTATEDDDEASQHAGHGSYWESDDEAASHEGHGHEHKHNEHAENFDSSMDLYVCLRYEECETEFMPAPFDECACGVNGQRPNRICEKFVIEVTDEKPKSFDVVKRRLEHCEIEDCKSLYDSLLDGCPAPQKLDCIPLAVIRNYKPGKRVTEAMIDNRSYRPMLPSTDLLDQLVRCILEKIPNRALTRIEDIGWTHNGTYTCHEFMKQLVGSLESPRGFEVTFGGKVNPEGVTRRTFQAVAVRYQEGGGGRSEVVPAKVELKHNGTRAWLYIDPEYARRKLHGSKFDLYLTMRCNLITDEHGRAVDGELMARLDEEGKYLAAPPTGDGTPGGLFESWIRVRP